MGWKVRRLYVLCFRPCDVIALIIIFTGLNIAPDSLYLKLEVSYRNSTYLIHFMFRFFLLMIFKSIQNTSRVFWILTSGLFRAKRISYSFSMLNLEQSRLPDSTITYGLRTVSIIPQAPFTRPGDSSLI